MRRRASPSLQVYMGVPLGGFVHLTVVSRPNSLPLPFRTPATQVRVWLKRSLLPSSTAKTGDDTSRARDMDRPHGWLLIGRSGVNGFKMNFSDLELTRSAKNGGTKRWRPNFDELWGFSTLFSRRSYKEQNCARINNLTSVTRWGNTYLWVNS